MKLAKCLGLSALDSPPARWQNHASVSCVPRTPSVTCHPRRLLRLALCHHNHGSRKRRGQREILGCDLACVGGVVSPAQGTPASAVNPAVPNVKGPEAMSDERGTGDQCDR